MKQNYRFFQNRECEYFPCHEGADAEQFNCLFCYCPLYLKENCLGNPSYILDQNGERIRDCSSCTVVHRPEMYDKVLNQLQRKDFVVSLDLRDLQEAIWERMSAMASWDSMDRETGREHRDTAIRSVIRTLDRHKYLYRISVRLKPFSRSCIGDGYFSFEEETISCQVLQRIDKDQVENGYVYVFHAPCIPTEESRSLLEQYYMELFQIACLDVVREWLQGYLERKHSVQTKRYCSPSFGPGFYGIGMEETPMLLHFLEDADPPVKWENGAMKPAMSSIGIYLISKTDVLTQCRDCISCIGNKEGCQYCGNAQ